MKFKKYLLAAFSGAVIFSSCSREDENKVSESDKINDFVWKGLNSWYYWQKDVPALADNAFKTTADYTAYINGKKPDELFYNLLYQYQKVDRFSWIVSDVNTLLQQFNGISKTSGIDVDLYLKDSGKVNVVGIVNYVVPNSPGDKAGVRRGDVISGVNGQPLTVNNYTQLFADQAELIVAKDVSVNNDTGVTTTMGESKRASVTAVILEENPVAFYKNFNLYGKNIGYLVYNGFKSNYNDELNDAFAKMKADGVKELVLDLRYNGGGSVATAVALGQMVTGQFTGSPYVAMEFNSKHSKYNSVDKLTQTMKTYDSNGNSTGTQNINSLGLNKIYVLTSHGTASASELTIAGLRSYINVVTVGSETYGKFVGSITLYDAPATDFLDADKRNKSHNWAMQPITFAYYNLKKDMPTTGGYLPDYTVAPKEYFGKLKEFGNTSDPALKKALELITGQSVGRVAGTTLRDNPKEFIGNRRTLQQFGTELYLDHLKVK